MHFNFFFSRQNQREEAWKKARSYRKSVEARAKLDPNNKREKVDPDFDESEIEKCQAYGISGTCPNILR